MKKIILMIAAQSISIYLIRAQGSFQNLNFEEENITAGTPPGTKVTLTGWTPSQVLYDVVSTGGEGVTLNDSMSPYINFTPLQGNYSVLLFGGPDGTSGITQTGLVPSTAKSILMDIGFPLGPSVAGIFTVSLGGQQINLVPVETYSSYTVYGGNIAAEAGLTEALTITESLPSTPIFPPSAIALDNIVFSPTAVPEPGTWAIISCGTGLMCAFNLMRRKS